MGEGCYMGIAITFDTLVPSSGGSATLRLKLQRSLPTEQRISLENDAKARGQTLFLKVSEL